MKKLIAKTRIGTEYLHSKQHAFFVERNAQKIADSLNKNKYQLNDGETWHVYDFDYMQQFYVTKQIYMTNTGTIKSRTI